MPSAALQPAQAPANDARDGARGIGETSSAPSPANQGEFAIFLPLARPARSSAGPHERHRRRAATEARSVVFVKSVSRRRRRFVAARGQRRIRRERQRSSSAEAAAAARGRSGPGRRRRVCLPRSHAEVGAREIHARRRRCQVGQADPAGAGAGPIRTTDLVERLGGGRPRRKSRRHATLGYDVGRRRRDGVGGRRCPIGGICRWRHRRRSGADARLSAFRSHHGR